MAPLSGMGVLSTWSNAEMLSVATMRMRSAPSSSTTVYSSRTLPA